MLSITDRGRTTAHLMPRGTGLLIPRVDGIPLEHRFRAGDQAVVRLLQRLVELNIADPSEWQRVHRDPTDYLQSTLNRWIDVHGAKAMRRRFCLSLTLTNVLDECFFDAGEVDPDGRQLYLILHPTSAAYVVAKPTLELLEREHPRLPVTFYRMFTRALSQWVRIYDYHDAEDHVEMLREWAEGEDEQYDIAELLPRPVGRPSHKPLVEYKGFLYQAASWKTARRVVAKVEHHAGELFPRVGFIVTNLSLPSRAVVRFYNKRGTAEQWIKEGKQAVKMTRLSCHRFRSNEVRLWLSVIAYPSTELRVP
jgi:hypothetical protein